MIAPMIVSVRVACCVLREGWLVSVARSPLRHTFSPSLSRCTCKACVKKAGSQGGKGAKEIMSASLTAFFPPAFSLPDCLPTSLTHSLVALLLIPCALVHLQSTSF